jgi:hypothetical protein
MPAYNNLIEFVQGSGGVSPVRFSVGAAYGEGANNKPDRYRVRLGSAVIDTPFGTKVGYQPTIISVGSRGLGANDLFIRLNGNNEYKAQGGAPTKGGGSRSNDTTGAIGGLYATNVTHAAIAEILIYDSALSDVDLGLIKSYLSKKYDIALTE